MSTYVQLEDYGNWSLQPVSPEQASEIQFLLNEAEVELEVVAGDLGDRITAALTTAARVKTALCGMVGQVMRHHADEMAMLAASDAVGARAMVSNWLKVGRRERWLVGMFSNAGSLDLSTSDPQLVHPTRYVPDWRRNQDWYGGYGYGGYCP